MSSDEDHLNRGDGHFCRGKAVVTADQTGVIDQVSVTWSLH
ncbi:MAG TPA: hypothetical protein P5526_04765 [Anaerolineae bacterium]|nr:hypothetical protein [Anaerolineae bacterium]